jgi:hypothetical protein
MKLYICILDGGIDPSDDAKPSSPATSHTMHANLLQPSSTTLFFWLFCYITASTSTSRKAHTLSLFDSRLSNPLMLRPLYQVGHSVNWPMGASSC